MIIRIIVIVSLVELSIMLTFGIFKYEANIYVVAGTDILLLVALSTPLIFFLVVTPFVKARDQAFEQLNYLATTDSLTQLSNRRSIDNQLDKFIASTTRHHFYGAVLLLDLDGFKNINDVYGHGEGDKVLIEVANRLRSRVRLDEVVDRLGGDEFVLLINNLDTNELIARNAALRIAEHLITLLSMTINLNDTKLSIGVSIGVRIFGLDEIDAESVIKEADLAMYRAKEAGKGQCVVFGE